MLARKSKRRPVLADNLTLTAALLLMATAPALLVVAAENSPDPAQITIENFAFVPPDLGIAAGTSVAWVNNDETPHTIITDDKAIRSGALDTGDRFEYRFTIPGTYAYHCSLHPQMTGKIIVR